MSEDYTTLISDHSTLVDQLLDDWSNSESQTLHQLTECSSEWAQDLDDVDKEYYIKANQTCISLTNQVHVTAI